MANKYIAMVTGLLREIEALVTSAGAADAGKIPALDGTGRLSTTVMPVGLGPETTSLSASGALAAGDFVNIFDDTGTAKCRKADGAVTGKEANGFVLASVIDTGTATVYALGGQANTQLTGLTPGARYWLSDTTPGQVTATAPTSGAGKVVQYLGRADSATSMVPVYTDPVVLAA
jgi:hypothetical protein